MHAMKGYRWLTLQNFTNFDGNTLRFLVTMQRWEASAHQDAEKSCSTTHYSFDCGRHRALRGRRLENEGFLAMD